MAGVTQGLFCPREKKKMWRSHQWRVWRARICGAAAEFVAAQGGMRPPASDDDDDDDDDDAASHNYFF
jgi:hypothetical protein